MNLIICNNICLITVSYQRTLNTIFHLCLLEARARGLNLNVYVIVGCVGGVSRNTAPRTECTAPKYMLGFN